MKKIVLIAGAALVLAGGGYWAYVLLMGQAVKEVPATNQTNDAVPQEETSTVPPAEEITFTFEQPKKSAHYVSNEPAHGSVLDSAPAGVALRFNFDLSTKSTISIIKDGQEVSTGVAAVSADKLTLSKTLSASGKGLYTVNYNACWPDGSCHDGHFQFGVKQ
jgi:methionine-rich copper-binding protein CopC